MSFYDELTGLVGDYVQSGNVQLYVKTNYGPEIPVYTGGSSEPSEGGAISDLVGFKAQIIVKNKKGEVLKTYGEPAPTEPLRVAALIAVLVGIIWVFK